MGKQEIETSYGRRDRRFSDSPSTKARPIEVCGSPAESAYLRRLTCDDGSRQFSDFASTEQARVGNVGYGGRCNRVIDRYSVRCPEKTYEVFMDPYRCPVDPDPAPASTPLPLPPPTQPTTSARMLPSEEPIHAATPTTIPGDCVVHTTTSDDRFRKITAGWPGQNDSMAISVGESLCLDAEEIGGRIVNFKPAPPDHPSPRPIRVKLDRLQNGGMVLVFYNPLAKWLRFSATLMRNTPREAVPAHLMPVGPGNTNMEIWKASEAEFLVLGKFEFTTAPPNAPPVAGDPLPR